MMYIPRHIVNFEDSDFMPPPQLVNVSLSLFIYVSLSLFIYLSLSLSLSLSLFHIYNSMILLNMLNAMQMYVLYAEPAKLSGNSLTFVTYMVTWFKACCFELAGCSTGSILGGGAIFGQCFWIGANQIVRNLNNY